MSWFTTRGSHSSTPIDRNTLITTAASRGMRRSADAIARRGERAWNTGAESWFLAKYEAFFFE
jgi:hypothetical protein